MLRKSTIATIVATFVFAGLLHTTFAGPKITKDQCTTLVDTVSAEIEKDAPGTFKKIIAGDHPYKDKDNPALYIFVYNMDVVIVAHPKAKLVGKSYKGKPDVSGKNFRDAIVKTAKTKKTGWVDYSYRKPSEKGIHPKTTYTKLVKGSDGKDYAVCAGKYK